jgi:hypothetical protein
MTTFNIPRLRLNRQRLTGAAFDTPEAAVRTLTAVQAQDYPAAKWALGQRVSGCLDTCVEAAFAAGRFLRTHVLRPTWHFVMPEDIRWLLALTAPRVKKAMSYYDRALELDEATFARSNSIITRALTGGAHLTRAEVAKKLAAAGITGDSQRIGLLLMRAELEALICSGARNGRQQTYALLDERAPMTPGLSREEALAELARRYFTGHGPALLQDFAWWSGLTVSDARAGIEMSKGHLVSEVVGANRYWFVPSTPPGPLPDPTIHLLPNYDEYLIAYRERDNLLHPSVAAETRLLKDVLARHFVLLNGLVVGGWRNLPAGSEVVLETRLLVPLTQPQARALQTAAEEYGRFLGKSVSIHSLPVA